MFSLYLFIVPLLCPFFGSPYCFIFLYVFLSTCDLLHCISASSFMAEARSDADIFLSLSKGDWDIHSKETAWRSRHWSSHTCRETFRLLPSGKEFVRLHAQKTRRCVSGPGLEAVGLLYCSRWCTFFHLQENTKCGQQRGGAVVYSCNEHSWSEPLCGWSCCMDAVYSGTSFGLGNVFQITQ